MKILIDNGHGIDTRGKQSPDGLLREYDWTRQVARQVVLTLRTRGYDAELLVTEQADVALTERARRVNAWCGHLGRENVLLVSIHVNAAGDGSRWLTAGGWSAYTSPRQTVSDSLATCLYDAAYKGLSDYIAAFKAAQAAGKYDSRQRPIRIDLSDGDPDLEARFYMLTATKCAAVLTENLFMDNRADKEYLLSESGKQTIAELHARGIASFISSLQP